MLINTYLARSLYLWQADFIFTGVLIPTGLTALGMSQLELGLIPGTGVSLEQLLRPGINKACLI